MSFPLKTIVALLLALAGGGCATLGYYAQAVGGQVELLARSRPIAELVADAGTPAPLKARLARVLEMRAFASRALALPDNASYTTYADLERPFVVWNVFAAPELALTPREWCFPIVGCVAYRGYFARAGAEAFAAGLRQEGLDVYVGGVLAYSTLGRLDDPVLNTVVNQPEAELAGLIFHELAHQVLYIPDDAGFNESFATVVEFEGIQRWLARDGHAERAGAYATRKQRDEQVVALVLAYRVRLEAVYGAAQGDDWKRARKRAMFDALKLDYRRLKQAWGGYAGYDRFFASDINNAHLVSIGTYRRYVPALQALLAETRGDLPAFYAAVARIGALPKAEREARLQALADEVW